jgi:hypothetical protein
MTRYSARLRQLEHRIAPGACPVCAGAPAVDFITLAPGESPPPRQACESCGAPHMAFIVVLDRPQPEPAALDDNARAESQSKPRVRRRQYCGPE